MNPDEAPPFGLLQSRRLYDDQTLGLRRDTLILPDGRQLERNVIEYSPASAIVPFIDREDGKRIVLLRHYRHPIARWIWEIPGGMRGPHESPEECARRELLEETGFRAGEVRSLGAFNPEPAFSDHVIDLFAGQVEPDGQGAFPEPEIARCRTFCVSEVEQLIARNEITSSWSRLGLALALRDT